MKQLTLLLILLLTGCHAGTPYLGDRKSEVTETLHLACKNYNAYERKYHGIDSASSVNIYGDTIIYNAVVDDTKYLYYFSNGECKEINMKLSCLPCVHMNRKWIFQGKWRVDNEGYLYRRKVPTKASIKRVEDCPYLYEVNLTRLDTAFQKRDFNKMKKVEKKLIGTKKYLLREG